MTRSRTERTPRIERRSERGLTRLTDRDLWMLEALGRMRFLTTSQLARLAFGKSRPAANKRLRQLLNSGLVRTWMRDLARDNIYGLTEIGARLLDPPPGKMPWPTPRGLDRQLDHLLLINDIRIAFILGLVSVGGELNWWKSDWELRQQSRERVIPDALFRIAWNGGQIYALEVDNNTKSPRSIITKLVRYKALSEFGFYGVHSYITLIVGRDEAYLERCREFSSRSGLNFPCWFTSFPKLEQHGILSPIWTSINGESSPSLPGLLVPPYRKEAAVPLST